MDASLKDYLSGLPTGKGSVRYGGRVGWLGRTFWGGSEWAGVCRGLRLLVYRQVPERVGSVSDKIPWYLKETEKVERPRRFHRGFGALPASFKSRSQRPRKDWVDGMARIGSKEKEQA